MTRRTDLEQRRALELNGIQPNNIQPGNVASASRWPARLGRSLYQRGRVSVRVDPAEIPLLLSTLALELDNRSNTSQNSDSKGGDSQSDDSPPWKIRYDGTPVEMVQPLEGRVSTDLDWFEVEASAQAGDTEVELPVLLAAAHDHDGLW